MLPINDLNDQIAKLPVEHQAPFQVIASRLQAQKNHKSRALELIQEVIQQLQLEIKYLVFDLHCTRRERDEARIIINGRTDDEC